MSKLSVIVITYNEEPDIAACLDSVSWADEIVVIDCGSTDDTLSICRNYTDKIIQVNRHGSGIQKQQALDIATCPWVLNLDADERISEALKEEIRNAISSDSGINGYYIPRVSRFLGEEIKYCGWQDDRPLRLFKRDYTKVTETQVHEGFLVDGTIESLIHPMIHEAYKSLYQYVEKLNEYTSIEVQNRLRAHPNRKIGWVHVALAPLGMFWKSYIVRSGHRDGMRGLLLCMLSSMSQMIGYAKVWEYQMRHRTGDGLFPPIRTEEVRSRQPGYNRLHKGGDDEFRWDDA